MAPISPGRPLTAVKKAKKQTVRTNQHRFEPFSRRIARLKIDPVHTVQKTRSTINEENLSTSFFQVALQEWSELNLSATFTNFLNRVTPLCGTLPQLLYHADTVFELLIEAIKTKDGLALEPLLALMAHLAHDLGQSFDAYFERTVKEVAQVAAEHDSPEVVEWSFTCLAWQFKYLSRVLVPDLRPLLAVMVPYLSSKRLYVSRFSAESLAFLIRKASAVYSRKPSCLEVAVNFVLSQVNENDRNADNYKIGAMTLFVETATGVDGQLHGSAKELFQCLFSKALRSEHTSSGAFKICDGVLTHIIHMIDTPQLVSIFAALFEEIRKLPKTSGDSDHYRAARLVITAIGTDAKAVGSKLQNWKEAFDTVSHLIALLGNSSLHADGRRAILTALTVTFQYAPLNELLPVSKSTLQTLVNTCQAHEFLAFTLMFSERDPQRFCDFVLPSLQRYITSHWQHEEVGIGLLLYRLYQANVITSQPDRWGHLACPPSWQEHITAELLKYSNGGDIPDDKLALYLELPNYIGFSQGSDFDLDYLTSTNKLAARALSDSDGSSNVTKKIVLGQAFPYFVSRIDQLRDNTQNLWTKITKLPEEYWTFTPFVRACRVLAQKLQPAEHIQAESIDELLNVLIDNLMSRSSALRQASLDLLPYLAGSEYSAWMQATINLLSQLLHIDYNPRTAREIALHLRRLPQQQRSGPHVAPLSTVMPSFCLGMLFSYHDQSRLNVCSAIAEMATEETERYVLEIVARWLQAPGSLPETSIPSEQAEKQIHRTGFEDLNVLAIIKLCETTFEDFSQPQTVFRAYIEQHVRTEATLAPPDSRLVGLQLLTQMSDIAEKRSRIWTPVFLASHERAKYSRVGVSSIESVSSHTLSPDIEDHNWTLPERKAFLKLIAKFTNPGVLYRAKEVYDVLHELLTSGNGEIRTLTVHAVVAWKESAYTQHKDLLMDLADDKMPISELGSILSGDSDSCRISNEHRQQILPVILRLIFGQLIGKSGIAGSQEERRRSIIRSLFRLPQHEVSVFLQIAMGRLGGISLIEDGNIQRQVLERNVLAPDQQFGFLRLMLTILEIEEWQFAPFGQQILPAILYCTTRAGKQSNERSQTADESRTPALIRNIRRTGLACLTAIFKYESDVQWELYLDIVFDVLITPGLANFAIETAQGVSGLLRLYATWAQHPLYVRYLRNYHTSLTGVIWDVLVVPSAKQDVKIFILEQIAIPLLSAAKDALPESNEAAAIFQDDDEKLLNSFAYLLESSARRQVLNAVTELISGMVPFVSSTEAAAKVLDLLVKLIQEPGLKLPSWTKSKVLNAIQSVLGVPLMRLDEIRKDRLYTLASAQYNVFKLEDEREVVGHLLQNLSIGDDQLAASVRICQDLNATSSSSLGAVDYDRRLEAFNTVNGLDLHTTPTRGWLPILHNLIYFSRSADDFSIRSNAVNSLKQFVHKSGAASESASKNLLVEVVLPATKRWLKDNSELVRADFVAILGLLIHYLPDEESLRDLVPLLVGNDEEASFFTNILHIQQHRRLRAIKRLLVEVEKGSIQATNTVTIFLPLLEKFLQTPNTEESDQTVKGQSLTAIAVLLCWTPWKVFKSLFRQYKQDLAAEELPKHTLRLLSGAADALTRAMDERYTAKTGDDDQQPRSHLAKSLPSPEIVHATIRTHLLPDLAKFVHLKDESEISLRIPASVTAVKLIKVLPENETALEAAPIMLDIAHILRSRVQESRDAARKTLSQAVVLLGASSILFVLKEMRNALTRGYQLHVLSYTLHTILVDSSPHLTQGDLDYCMSDLVSVVLDDIFGAVGQEKENQDYISSMKEVKSSKSFDSMELLAKSASAQSLMKLMQPLETLLSGTLTTKQTRHVDELLRRVGTGLSRSEVAASRDLLVFAYQLIQEFYKQKSAAQQQKILTTDDVNRQRFLIELKGSHKATSGTTSPLLYKIPKFALDIVRSTLQKHEALMVPENVDGFLPIIGDALVEAQEDVKTSALRLLSAIMKLPIPRLDDDSQIYISEAVRMLRNATSTNEESAQAALKLINSVLRESREVTVRDSDLAYLLHRITPDLEEPDRQGVSFNFIRAVLSRKIQLPEVYELVDKIAIMMVTNQVRGARDVARGVYVNFLVEYEQHPKRWSKQLKFLLKNLEYEYPEGRQSVMEAVNLLVAKKRDSQGREMVSTFFIPVMLRMASDEHDGCREMAGALLAQLFRRADQKEVDSTLDLARAWTEQAENLTLVQLGLQAFSIYLNVSEAVNGARISSIRGIVMSILQAEFDVEGDWELRFHALQLLAKLAEASPEAVLSNKQSGLWSAVRKHIRHPHPWVQSSALSLVNIFFTKCPSTSLGQVPLVCEHGLRFDEPALQTVLKSSVWILKRSDATQDVSTINVQILLLLGRCVNADGLQMPVRRTDDEDSDTEDESRKPVPPSTDNIPATKYLLDQLSHILRREPPRYTSTSIRPKLHALSVLTSLIPHLTLTPSTLPTSSLTPILAALQHVTDPSLATPRSTDTTFADAYQGLIDAAHGAMEAIQKAVGDNEYTKLMTEASKARRVKREERRTKRRIERVLDPEGAAKARKRRHERESVRRKEIGGGMKRRRLGM